MGRWSCWPGSSATPTLGQTYLVVRRASDGRIVRRWVPPHSPFVYQIPWAVVNTQYTVPVGVIGAIPLDDQFPEPNLLVRRFDGGDDRIFGYDAAIGTVAPRARHRDLPVPGLLLVQRDRGGCRVLRAAQSGAALPGQQHSGQGRLSQLFDGVGSEVARTRPVPSMARRAHHENEGQGGSRTAPTQGRRGPWRERSSGVGAPG